MKRIAILLVLLLARAGWATLYYVDTTADEGGNGTTTATTGAHCAWNQISDITGLGPSDTVNFHRDQVWYETLTVPASGSDAAHPITFDAYSTGADPNIDGENTRGRCIDINSKNFITVQNFILHNPGGAAGSGMEVRGTSTGVIGRNIVSQYSSNQAFQHNDSPSVTYYNITGKNCVDDGFSMHGGTAVIVGGTFTDNAQGINMVAEDNGPTLTASDITITGSTDNDAAVYLTAAVAGTVTATITGLETDDGCQVDASCVLTLARARFYTTTAAHIRCAGTLTVSASLFLNTGGTTSGVNVQSGGTAEIYNCLFHDNNKNGRGVLNAGTATVKNCIFNNLAAAFVTTNPFTMTLGYNDLYGNTANFGGDGYGPGNTNGIAADPLWVHPGEVGDAIDDEDFHLLPGSPCINAGTNVGLTTDCAGTTVPQGSAPDMGAYEFLLPVAATTPDPTNEAVDVSVTPTLSWTDGGGSTSYDVYLSDDASIGVGDLVSDDQAGTTYTPGASLTPYHTYYWRIDSNNDAGTTTGTERHFRTESKGGAGALLNLIAF